VVDALKVLGTRRREAIEQRRNYALVRPVLRACENRAGQHRRLNGRAMPLPQVVQHLDRGLGEHRTPRRLCRFDASVGHADACWK